MLLIPLSIWTSHTYKNFLSNLVSFYYIRLWIDHSSPYIYLILTHNNQLLYTNHTLSFSFYYI